MGHLCTTWSSTCVMCCARLRKFNDELTTSLIVLLRGSGISHAPLCKRNCGEDTAECNTSKEHRATTSAARSFGKQQCWQLFLRKYNKPSNFSHFCCTSTAPPNTCQPTHKSIHTREESRYAIFAALLLGCHKLPFDTIFCLHLLSPVCQIWCGRRSN